jgi:molecular chaperone DnaK
MARTIGIDLGTTNSVVAFVENGRPETIPNPEGSKLTPSVVLYTATETVVGELAKRQLVTNPGDGVRSIKRLMGKRFSEVGSFVEDFPYTVVEGDDDRAEVALGRGAVIAPEAVSADVLARLRQTAEDYLGEEITQAVITVPAYFNDSQRTATKIAAEMAGLEALRLLNEPTAAALAYGAGRSNDEIIAVFDFGGGTFDVSILQLRDDIFEVLSTCGDTHLGGDDLDLRMMTEICDEIIQQTGIDPTQDAQAMARIHEAAEKAKREVSSVTSTEISLPFIVADSKGPKHYTRTLKREDFVAMVQPILDRLIEPCEQAIKDAGLTVDKIQNVLLVGGSTRIPRVAEMVQAYFKREPNRSLNPDEAVALGAAIQGGVMSGSLAEVLLLDVTPLSLGIELAGGVFKPLITRNSSIPCEASRKFTTVVDNQTVVLVNVLQGERKIAAENRQIAQFRLTGIPPMPRELPEIMVRFQIDANGILEVAAMDLTSGQQTGIVVEGYGQLAADKREAQKAVVEAEKAAIADEMFARFAERRTRAERFQNSIQRIIEAGGSSIIEEDLKAMKETMFRHDLAINDRDELGMSVAEERLQELADKYSSYLAVNDVLGTQFDFKRAEGVEAIAAHPSVTDDDFAAEMKRLEEEAHAAVAAKQAAPVGAAGAGPGPGGKGAPPPPEEEEDEEELKKRKRPKAMKLIRDDEKPKFMEEGIDSGFDPANFAPPPPPPGS